MEVSKSHRLCYHLLTSKEIGYKDVHMEVPILNGLTYADIYVRDINLVIMVNGPNHYYLDEPTILIKSLMDDYVGNYMDVLKLNYDHFD